MVQEVLGLAGRGEMEGQLLFLNAVMSKLEQTPSTRIMELFCPA
jgi:hypothetical protein